jgi:hypothetical protein
MHVVNLGRRMTKSRRFEGETQCLKDKLVRDAVNDLRREAPAHANVAWGQSPNRYDLPRRACDEC